MNPFDNVVKIIFSKPFLRVLFILELIYLKNIRTRLHNGYKKIQQQQQQKKKKKKKKKHTKILKCYQDCIVPFINYFCLLACFSNITFRRYPSKSRSINATISK